LGKGDLLKESDLFEPVKKWLEDNGYQVFSEVSPRYCSSRADVVGINDETITVVELKLSLSLDLLEQAVYWARHKYANYVYIAVPWNKKESPLIKNWLVEYICKQFKIGVLFVRKQDGRFRFVENNSGFYIDEKPYIKARYIRLGKQNVFRDTIEQYKQEYINSELKGGHNGGGYITPYRVTIERVKEFLKNVREGRTFSLWWYENGELIDLRERAIDGWVDINTILDYCETHYASPKPSLSKALRDFEYDWCENKIINRRLHFRYRSE
jgi:Holliday junction resolvase